MASQTVAERLAGRTLWIPRMTYSGARMMAAVFRSVGIDAAVTPPSATSARWSWAGSTAAARSATPQKVTLGDFLRIIHSEGFDPAKTAFFMPTAEGPCRFGQYAPYLQAGAGGAGLRGRPHHLAHQQEQLRRLRRSRPRHDPPRCGGGWWPADILRKMLLKTRPYETTAGDADEAYEQAMDLLEAAVRAAGTLSSARPLGGDAGGAGAVRDLFRAVPARYTKDRPLIGVVGEIFCRLNTFSNYDAVRQDRGPRRGGLAIGRVRVGLVHQLVAEVPAAARRQDASRLAMLGAVRQERRPAPRRAQAAAARSRRTSSATRSPTTSTRRSSSPAGRTCPPTGRWARWSCRSARASTCTARAPTASSTSARSPA